MVEIAFHFVSYRLLGLFLLVFAVGVALLTRYFLGPRRRLASAAIAFFLLNLGVLAAWAATIRVDSDEVEHLHCAWLVSQGLTPYRDFWQNHSPLLYYLLAPLVARFHSPAVLLFSRAVAGFLFLLVAAAAGWLTWRVFGDRAAAALSVLMVLALGVRVEAAWIRPDQLANLLALVSLALSCATPPSRRTVLLAGAAFGLALSFSPKPFLAGLAFPLAVFFSPEFPLRDKFGYFLFYLLGGIAGGAPLFVLLSRLRITSEWITWTFLHHAAQGHVESAFPAALALVAAAGCAATLLAEKQTARRNPRTLLLAAGFLLQTLGCAMIPYRIAVDLMLWVALAAALASPLLMGWIQGATGQLEKPQKVANPQSAIRNPQSAIPMRLAALAAAAVVLFEIEALAPLLTRRTLGNFASDRARLAWMIEQARGQPVVLVTPIHSIFSRNGTGLYHLWQYGYFINQPLVSRSLAGFAQKLQQARPALIAAAPRRITDDPIENPELRPPLFDSLVYANVITQAEWEDLGAFVRQNYVLRQVEGEQFYVLKAQSSKP